MPSSIFGFTFFTYTVCITDHMFYATHKPARGYARKEKKKKNESKITTTKSDEGTSLFIHD